MYRAAASSSGTAPAVISRACRGAARAAASRSGIGGAASVSRSVVAYITVSRACCAAPRTPYTVGSHVLSAAVRLVAPSATTARGMGGHRADGLLAAHGDPDHADPPAGHLRSGRQVVHRGGDVLIAGSAEVHRPSAAAAVAAGIEQQNPEAVAGQHLRCAAAQSVLVVGRCPGVPGHRGAEPE